MRWYSTDGIYVGPAGLVSNCFIMTNDDGKGQGQGQWLNQGQVRVMAGSESGSMSVFASHQCL